jgi:cell division transport system ATP-binding protein
MISFNHVYKTYNTNTHALRDLTMTIHSDDFIFLTGDSGAGKTTLFKLLTLQEKITSGDLLYKNQNLLAFNAFQIAKFRKSIGIVFQDFKLISELNLYDNVALPLKIQKKPKQEIKQKVEKIMNEFKIDHLAQQFPDFISGGEKQRVAIARAVVHEPNFVLADEPTGNLDRKNSDLIMSYFEKLSELGVTVLVATHDESVLKRNEHRKNYRHLILSAGELKADSVK